MRAMNFLLSGQRADRGRRARIGALPTLAVISIVVSGPLRALAQPASEAISREVSVFNLGVTNTGAEAISREISVYDTGLGPVYPEAISREVSVFISTNPVLFTLATNATEVLPVGTNWCVPIYMASDVSLTNVELTWSMPPGRLTNFNVEPVASQICTNSLSLTSNGWPHLQFITCPGQWLTGTQQLAWLCFTLVSNQSSAFTYATVSDFSASERSDHLVTGFGWDTGRFVVVGLEPLLECVRNTNAQPVVILYGEIGPGYSLESRSNLTTASWQGMATNFTMTNLSLLVQPPFSPSSQEFYRALRVQ